MRLLMSRVSELMAARNAHAARTVVLLPYFHLIVPAREAWGQSAPQGFTPRFETTQTWSAARGFDPVGDSLALDTARDLLVARTWLERAGLGDHADLLSGRLVEAARQVAPVAAAVTPSGRRAWASGIRAAIAASMDAPVLALEAHLARIAIDWAGASAFATDGLLDAGAMKPLDLLVVVQGLQTDLLAAALLALVQDKGVTLQLEGGAAIGEVSLHEAVDPSDEAERAAACVIRHVEAGRTPVAVAAVDRILTRRIRAMLGARGIAIRDETGWKLSTTRAAAGLMLTLRASAWGAGTDAVIDWLKNAPAIPAWQVTALERRVRKAGVREWRSLRADDAREPPVLAELVARVQAWREQLGGTHALAEWPAQLREVLQATGQWPGLQRDAAGLKVIDALRLAETDSAEWQEFAQASRRWTSAAFTSWVNEALEAASFTPEVQAQEQVVILPLSQLAGRSFAAVVVPGCDEARLNPAPDPVGIWTAAQRKVLGLPDRQALESEMRHAWREALAMPVVDLVWRRTDASGEALLASPLVQQMLLDHPRPFSTDPRVAAQAVAHPIPRPAPVGLVLPLERLSASAYEDLRRCPYRYFAMRQLGLHEAQELDVDVDKRDFGSWLHEVLGTFHQSMQASWEPPGPARRDRLELTAAEVTRTQRFHEGEFLPFAAAWPQVRDGYLKWLEAHEAKEGATFEAAEAEREMPLGALTLFGRIDRVDRLPDGRAMVMDYKTEAPGKSTKRAGQPSEDTQLAFYAALLGDDTLRAAYVNVGERGETKTIEQKFIVEARDLLVEGILDELARIEAGAALPALGEGQVCDFCAARGLCRRDSWS